MTSSVTVAIDLGKSLCRVRADDARHTIWRDGPGSPGIAGRDGIALALAAILPLLDQPLLSGSRACIGVGAAGVLYAPEAAAAFAAALRQETAATVAVASDVVTAHAGALGGGSGVLLVAGTGAVALGIRAHDDHLVDGWGPDLGDLGGGSWIGREGIRAVLRARDGLGGPTLLTEALAHLIAADDAVGTGHVAGHGARNAAAADHDEVSGAGRVAGVGAGRGAGTGDPSPILWAGRSTAAARQIARFAPAVLAAAEHGDPAAIAICAEAVELLTDTAHAAASRGDAEHSAVVLHGGLTAHAGFRARLAAALTGRGLDVCEPYGDALDGAAMIAEGRAPLHERFVHRVP